MDLRGWTYAKIFSLKKNIRWKSITLSGDNDTHKRRNGLNQHLANSCQFERNHDCWYLSKAKQDTNEIMLRSNSILVRCARSIAGGESIWNPSVNVSFTLTSVVYQLSPDSSAMPSIRTLFLRLFCAIYPHLQHTWQCVKRNAERSEACHGMETVLKLHFCLLLPLWWWFIGYTSRWFAAVSSKGYPESAS